MPHRYLPALRATLLAGILSLPVLAGYAQTPAARVWTDVLASNPGAKAARSFTDARGTTYVVGAYEDASAWPGTAPLLSNPAGFVGRVSATSQWAWVRTIVADTTFSQCKLLGVAGDGHGGVYAQGSFIGRVTLAPGVRLTSYNNPEPSLLARYDSMGTLLWVRKLPGTTVPLVADAQGNVTMAFGFEHSLDVGGFTLYSTGNSREVGVARFDAQGTCQWVVQSSGTADEGPNSLALDAQSNALVTGYVTSARQWMNPDSVAQFGAERFVVPAEVFGGSIPGPPFATMFAARLSPAGQWQWVAHAHGGPSWVSEAVVGPGGEAYLTVAGTTDTYFGPTLHPAPGISTGVQVARLSATGQWEWLHALSGGSLLTLSPAGHPCVAGTFSQTLQLDGITILTDTRATIGQRYALGVVQLDPSGQLEWAVAAPGVGADPWTPTIVGVGIDAQNRVTVVGNVLDSLTLGPTVLTNPTFPATQWVRTFVARIEAGPTGLPAAPAAGALSLYPNPVPRGQPLTVAVPAGWVGARVEVLNVLGQTVATVAAATAHTRLPTAGLPAGCYTLRVRTAARQLSRRLVVE